MKNVINISKNYRNSAMKRMAKKINENRMIRVIDYDPSKYFEYVPIEDRYMKWDEVIKMIASDIEESKRFTTYGIECYMRDDNRSIYTGWVHCGGWMPHNEYIFASVQLCNRAWNEAYELMEGGAV